MIGTHPGPSHEESVRDGFPPQLLRATKGIGRLGSWALPSETISLTSIAAGALLFAVLSFSEATRFFFRLTFSPMLLSGPALALSLLIAWRGSLRPGPILPRLWVLILATLNLSLLVVAAYVRTGDVPPVFVDPFPWHALTLTRSWRRSYSSRLYPMHPLKTLVQTIAPLSLASVLSVAVFGCLWLLDREMTQEQTTLRNMSAELDASTAALRSAAAFPYNQPSSLRGDEEAVTATWRLLALPPMLNLPEDERRWQAARILENEQLLEPGQLERSVRDSSTRSMTS